MAKTVSLDAERETRKPLLVLAFFCVFLQSSPARSAAPKRSTRAIAAPERSTTEICSAPHQQGRRVERARRRELRRANPGTRPQLSSGMAASLARSTSLPKQEKKNKKGTNYATHRARAAADPALALDRVVDGLGRARLQGAHRVVVGAPGLGGLGGRRSRRRSCTLLLPAQSPRRPRDDAADLLERVEEQREADGVRQHDGRDRNLVQRHGCERDERERRSSLLQRREKKRGKEKKTVSKRQAARVEQNSSLLFFLFCLPLPLAFSASLHFSFYLSVHPVSVVTRESTNDNDTNLTFTFHE